MTARRIPTEEEAREASRIVDDWFADREGVSVEDANRALLVVDAYLKPARKARRRHTPGNCGPCLSSCTLDLDPDDDDDGGTEMPVRRAS